MVNLPVCLQGQRDVKETLAFSWRAQSFLANSSIYCVLESLTHCREEWLFQQGCGCSRIVLDFQLEGSEPQLQLQKQFLQMG